MWDVVMLDVRWMPKPTYNITDFILICASAQLLSLETLPLISRENI